MEAIKYILTNIVLPLVVGGIGVYAYPRIESYLKNRSLTSRQRKAIEILREYGVIRSFKENPILLVANMLFLGILGLVLLLLLIFLLGVGIYTPLPSNNILRSVAVTLLGLFSVYPASFLIRAAKRYTSVIHLDEYKSETQEKIKKLGLSYYKPEFLDDIDVLSAQELEGLVKALTAKK